MLLSIALSTVRASQAITHARTVKPFTGCFPVHSEARQVAIVAASFDRFAQFLAPLQKFTRAEFDALSSDQREGIIFAGFDKFGFYL